MMQIDFTSSVDQVDWNAVAELYGAVGWGRRNPLRVQRAFAHSTVVCFGYHEGRLINCSRAVSDGEFYATIFDVLVHPSYQVQELAVR